MKIIKIVVLAIISLAMLTFIIMLLFGNGYYLIAYPYASTYMQYLPNNEFELYYNNPDYIKKHSDKHIVTLFQFEFINNNIFTHYVFDPLAPEDGLQSITSSVYSCDYSYSHEYEGVSLVSCNHDDGLCFRLQHELYYKALNKCWFKLIDKSETRYDKTMGGQYIEPPYAYLGRGRFAFQTSIERIGDVMFSDDYQAIGKTILKDGLNNGAIIDMVTHRYSVVPKLYIPPEWYQDDLMRNSYFSVIIETYHSMADWAKHHNGYRTYNIVIDDNDKSKMIIIYKNMIYSMLLPADIKYLNRLDIKHYYLHSNN
jgi:hypothetical protein